MDSEKDKSVIPPGPYCYERLEPIPGTNGLKAINLCPYWSCREGYPSQMDGYCSFLDLRDWEEGTLLWDQVKECGENLGDEEIYFPGSDEEND